MASCNDTDYTNPHWDCIRNLLGRLVCHDYDICLVNSELRNLQTKYNSEIEAIEDRCARLRKSVKNHTHDPTDFTKHLRNIDAVRELYSDKIKELTKNKLELYALAKETLLQLSAKKFQYHKFHEITLSHFKCESGKCMDPQVILDIDRKLNEMTKKYIRDTAFIRSTEHELQALIREVIRTYEYEKPTKDCCFQDYAFLPKGKNFGAVQAMADEIKISNLPALKQALASAHVYQATDVKSFVSSYLLHMEKCELAAKEKLMLLGNSSG